jgi:hypothetical protein
MNLAPIHVGMHVASAHPAALNGAASATILSMI